MWDVMIRGIFGNKIHENIHLHIGHISISSGYFFVQILRSNIWWQVCLQMHEYVWLQILNKNDRIANTRHSMYMDTRVYYMDSLDC